MEIREFALISEGIDATYLQGDYNITPKKFPKNRKDEIARVVNDITNWGTDSDFILGNLSLLAKESTKNEKISRKKAEKFKKLLENAGATEVERLAKNIKFR